MIRPLLIAGLTILTLGSTTAAYAHDGSRGDRYASGRDGCETRSRYGNAWEDGRSGRFGYRARRDRYGSGARYGSTRRGDYRDRSDRWDHDRDDYRDGHREHSRIGDRYEREWEDREDGRRDRLEAETLPVRPRSETVSPGNRTPGAGRRTPNSGITRRPAS